MIVTMTAIVVDLIFQQTINEYIVQQIHWNVLHQYMSKVILDWLLITILRLLDIRCGLTFFLMVAGEHVFDSNTAAVICV